jgi:group I intron endonuclease
MNYNSGIYEIKNTENGKRYIGSSKELERRVYLHKYELNKEEHHNPHLQRSWNKYGGEAFEFNILLYCSKENLEMYEQRFLDSSEVLSEGYNIAKDVEAPMRGREFTEETKQKISESKQGENNPMYGEKRSEETKQKIRENLPDFSGKMNPFHGKAHSEETKQKISEVHKGKKVPKEARYKISEALQGKNNPFHGKAHSEETKQKIREANQKLSDEQVKEIRKMLKQGEMTQKEISEQFSIDCSVMSRINTGEAYSNVDSSE